MRVPIIVVCTTLLAAETLAGCAALPSTGSANEYGFFAGTCARKELSFPNHHGLVASVRQIECTARTMDEPFRDYFIFVRHPSDSDEPDNLILGYRQYYEYPYWDTVPSLTWISSSSLRIAMGIPSALYSLRNRLNGVTLSYEVGGLRIPDSYRFRTEPDWLIFTQ